MPIRVLPPLLVNQIAAGEVVERPANVVKELLENALDAGAARIEVESEGGGRDLIRVTDDGQGIPAAELPLAVAAHATSKISTLEDLAAVRSMGFRGEALASIAAVSRLRLLSRQRGGQDGAVLEVEGDLVQPVRPAAAPPGTTVLVRNLFFNTPARRRFLKSDASEAGRIAEVVTATALAHPAVAFRLVQGGRTVLDLPIAQSRRERVCSVLGEELSNELLDLGPTAASGARPDQQQPSSSGFDQQEDPALSDRWLRVEGVAGRPAAARPTGKHLRIYVNGRPVVDRMLSHAVREAYRGLIDPSRHPTAVVFVDLDPREVDVNVHPTKAEVRFRNGGVVHQAVQRAVRSALRTADLVPEVRFGPESARNFDEVGLEAEGDRRFARPQDRPAGWASRSGAADRSGPWLGPAMRSGQGGQHGLAAPGWAEMLHRSVEVAEQEGSIEPQGRSQAQPQSDPQTASPSAHAADGVGATWPAPPLAPADARLPDPTAILQVHRKYVVVEDAQGLAIVDQHALHERVMFERFHARLGQGPLECQRLLLPATVTADRSRMEALEEHRTLVEHLGFDAVAGGPESILVHGVPTLLHSRGVDAVEFLAELLDRAAAGDLALEREAALVEVLSMMACKAAVKAGDHLSPQELAALLRQREEVERSSACPHGRPTTLRITLAELDRWFGR